MSCAAIVAVKSTVTAKSRLRDALSLRAHDVLVEAMLRHVVSAARGAHGIAEVLLVSPEERTGADWPYTVVDAAHDLNAAFNLGARHAFAHGHDAALLLPADLATVTSANLDEFIDLGMTAGAALAPDRAGAGTNAVWMELKRPLALSFGADSFAKHSAECSRLDISPAIVRTATLSLDIDTSADLDHLRGIAEYDFLWSSERSVA